MTSGATAGQVQITGSVFTMDDGAQTAESAPGASVRASVDRNGDGVIGSDELVEATADDGGAYSVTINAAAEQNVVLRFAISGFVTGYRTVRAGYGASAKVDVSLRASSPLACTDGVCATADKKLTVQGLDSELSAQGRTFNPVSESSQFPGRYGDDEGNLLISGVFSHVELTDASGSTVDALNSAATLRMQMPRETWPIVVDITPGNGAIDVPLYAFDDVSGEWKREGQGVLEDGSGAVIAEEQLATIRDGSFAGVVVARGEVQHFSYWNIDWPIASHGCLTFEVRDADGAPIDGAVVSFSGTTYTGSSDGVAVDASGGGCVDVMRSEAPGEDVDNDGITGETQKVRARIFVGDRIYDAGEFEVSTSAGTCAGTCEDLGVLTVSSANELVAAVCTVSGTVRDLAGNAVADATVYAFDELLEFEFAYSTCTPTEQCFVVETDATGHFTVSTVVLSGLTMTAFSSTRDDTSSLLRLGQTSRSSCPGEAVTITLDQGYGTQELALSAAGGVISWSPSVGIWSLTVLGADDTYKWGFFGDDTSSITGPVSYGVVPAGAIELQAAVGELAAGDTVEISGFGTTAEGYSVTYYGSVVVSD